MVLTSDINGYGSTVFAGEHGAPHTAGVHSRLVPSDVDHVQLDEGRALIGRRRCRAHNHFRGVRA